MCFSRPKIPDPPPPVDVPPVDEPGEVEIGAEAQASRGQKRKYRGRRALTVGLITGNKEMMLSGSKELFGSRRSYS